MNDKIIWDYFLEKLNNVYGVAGLMGNLYAESGLKPTNLQNSANKRLNITDEEYTFLVDSDHYPDFVSDKAGYGICQWTFWNRKKALLEYAKEHRTSVGDLSMQLDFLWEELTEKYGSLVELLKTAISVREASDAFLFIFERPKDQGTKVQEKRAEYGERFLKENTCTKGAEMAIIIGSAHSDENGNIKGGLPGDQKQRSTPDYSGEVSLEKFYVSSKGWYILRPKNPDHAKKIAEAMKRACENQHIGYNQSRRYDILKHGTGTTVNTDCDCSSLVRQCVKEGTGKDPGDFTTASEASALEATGLFDPKKKYESGDVLYTGDVLVSCVKGHTVIITSGKSRATSLPSDKPLNKDPKWEGRVTASELSVRKWAGTENAECTFSPLMRGEKISVCDSVKASDGSKWYYVRKNGKYGFSSAKYIVKA